MWEILGGLRPAEQTGERQFPKTEIGHRAHQLIQDFKKAIGDTPEFTQTLKDLYFREAQHDSYSMFQPANPFERPISFDKGDYSYRVHYATESEREGLRVDKFPRKTEEHAWLNESVSLSAYVNRETRQFDSGHIQHSTIYKDKEGDHPMDSPIALHRVQDFLTTNFPMPEAQPPTEK
jgi:hypothetical protein